VILLPFSYGSNPVLATYQTTVVFLLAPHEMRIPGMLQNQRPLACALLLAFVWARLRLQPGQSCDPGEALEHTVQISAGGPYVAKAGSPITLRGEYIVAGPD